MPAWQRVLPSDEFQSILWKVSTACQETDDSSSRKYLNVARLDGFLVFLSLPFSFTLPLSLSLSPALRGLSAAVQRVQKPLNGVAVSSNLSLLSSEL